LHPDSDQKSDIASCPLCARTGREQMQHRVQVYSITSSASARRDDGRVRPSIRAVSALMISSNLLDWAIGRSTGTH
jgi:hypothetical protein